GTGAPGGRQPPPVLGVQPRPGPAVEVRAAQPPPARAPVVLDDRARRAADAQARPDEPPREVDVRAVLEALVEAAHRVEGRAPEGHVDRRALRQVLRAVDRLVPGLVEVAPP